MFRSLFGGENLIWNWLGKITDVIVLSLFFCLTSIPIITAGASLLALYRMMFLETTDTEGYLVRSYFRFFKENFKKGTLAWLISLAIGLFLAGDIYICWSLQMQAAKMLLPFFIILAVILVLLLHYVFPLLSIVDAGAKRVLFLSFMLAIKEWWRTIFLAFVTVIMIAVGIFAFWPFLLLAPGVITFFHAIIFRGVFKKYNIGEGS